MLEQVNSKKNWKSFQNLEQKIYQTIESLNNKAEIIFSYFCYLSGGIAFEIEAKELLEKITPRFFEELKHNKPDFEISQKQKHEYDLRIIRKQQQKIKYDVNDILNFAQIIMYDLEFNLVADKIKQDDSFNELEQNNNFFLESFLETIKKIARILEKNCQTVKQIYQAYLDDWTWPEIVKEFYGKSCLDKKNEINRSYLVYKIYCDQVEFEKILELLKIIQNMNEKQMRLWIKKTKNHLLKF